MKQPLLFVAALFVLFAASSCAFEKRLYRDGWYVQHSHYVSREQTVLPASEASAVQPQQADQPVVPAATESDTVKSAVEPAPFVPEHAPAALKEKIQQLREKKQLLSGDPTKKMTYIEARKSMAEKGCNPHPMATAIYVMGLVSICTFWFGFGLLFTLIALILSIFAVNAVLAKGECVDENLAIIAAGRRMCFLALIITAILTLIVIAIVFSLIPYFSSI